MCGIAGLIAKTDSTERFAAVLPRLEAAIAHRGPDDRGTHVSRDGRAGLVHVRLSILDLSAAGHQPMFAVDDRYAIVFNGEIFNFRALAASLVEKGFPLRSHSDTEVILLLYHLLGADCVRELRGMFAFAIWDDLEKTCFIARDPLGIKPLYYHHDAAGTLSFASELRALRATGLAGGELDADAVAAFFQQGSVPEPQTLLRDVRCLEAGHWLRWRDGTIESQSYWTVPIGLASDAGNARNLTSDEDTAAVRAALLDSVQHHFVSDVPVGLFLSGGIDSTALLALSRALGHDRLNTYSISFDEADFNEGDLARRTAEHFGSVHLDSRLTGTDARGLFDRFLHRLDQPSVDGFNTFAVSQVAHAHGAKVVLSGLGGDELFGSYPSFRRAPSMIRLARALGPLRSIAGATLRNLAGSSRAGRFGDFLSEEPTVDAAMSAGRGIFSRRDAVALARHFAPGSVPNAAARAADLADVRDTVSAHELSHYMRNQLLRDSDVASMAWGLELRVPLVDRALIEVLARIPAARRLRANKAMLVEAVPEIPSWVTNAPKRGFSFPFEKWFREDWQGLFADTTKPMAGVRPVSWSQRWSLFVFRSWLGQS